MCAYSSMSHAGVFARSTKLIASHSIVRVASYVVETLCQHHTDIEG